MSLFQGWYQLAFERELKAPLTPTGVADLPLMLVNHSGRLQAFDPVCPHRGAHLAYGGKLDGHAIVCPFHGRRIGLGDDSGCRLTVRGYQTLTVGGLIFVLLDERYDHGFRALIEELDRTHFFVQGFTVTARTRPELVIENGFDPAHFKAVHGLTGTPDLRLGASPNGEMVVEGTLSAPAFDNVWNAQANNVRFTARVFSPNICVTTLCSGRGEYLVISAATPAADDQCVVRVSLALPPGPNGERPDPQAVRALLRDSKLAYDQDLVIWEHLFPRARCRFDAEDDLVIRFRDFCGTFLPTDDHGQGTTHESR